jgi:hypothetical protein
MKKLVFAVMLAAGVAAGFAVGRKCAGGACGANAPSAAVAPSDNALNEAKKRIAALEAELAEAKKDAKRAKKRASRAEKAVDEATKMKDAVASFSVATNADIVAELKKQLPEAEFTAATNALAGLKAKLSERAKGRREFLASLDVSGLSAEERENHNRFMELFDRREKAMSKMKGLIPDEKTIGELMEVEMQMHPLAKRERKALLGALTKELGYSGDDGAVVADTIEGIFDCTGSGGLGGLADIGGLMEGMEIQPGVSVETHVIGL